MGYSFDSVKHVHLLNGKALMGTTQVITILSKPLGWWIAGQTLEPLGWMNSKKHTKDEREIRAAEVLEQIGDMNVEQYVDFLDKSYKAHDTTTKEAAEAGTDLHKEIEAYIKDCISDKSVSFSHRILPFVRWAKENVQQFLFSELHCYSESLYVGGIVDFAYVDMKGKRVLGDVKSAKDAYIDHWIQIAGYSLQLEENGGYTADGKLIHDPLTFDYHMVWTAGSQKAHFNHEIGRMRRAFVYALNLYKEKKWFENGSK